MNSRTTTRVESARSWHERPARVGHGQHGRATLRRGIETRWVTRLAIAALAIAFCGSDPALADAIRLKNGQVLRGDKVAYKRRDKLYIVFTKDADLTYAEDQVSAVTVSRPKEYTRAIKMVDSGQAAGAIPLLKEIVKTYYKLEWDRRAKPLLAEAYFKAGDTRSAIRECEEVFADPGLKVSSRLTKLYLSALRDSKDYEKIEATIVKMIGTGSRESAAMAQMFRGDIFFEQQKYREALTKGYLRTAEFFQDVKDVQPMALSKTIECYKALGEDKTAEVFRKRLLAKYPRSEYARKLK